MEILSIENLSFSYGNSENPSNILHNINLKVYDGELILLCGPSGCGKTSLLRIIKSSLMPDGNMEGCVRTPVPDEKIGYVFQQPDSQLVMEKVFDELIFGCENLGLSTQEINQRLSEITAFFGIEDLTDRECATLSGGQKQLINLASVMMMEPDIIIFDEPLSQLDPIASTAFINMVKRLHDELGITIIICEHNLADILPVASKIWFMNNGNVVEFSSADSYISYILNDAKEYICCLPPLIRAKAAYDNFLIKSRQNTGPANIHTDATGFENTHTAGIYPYSVSEFKKLGIPSDFLDDYIKKQSQNTEVCETSQPVCGKNIYFKYHKNDNDVLKGLNINIPSNSLYAIIGGNGSGKSTLLSLMTGYRKPYRGEFKGEFKDILKEGSQNNIAYLPQNPLCLFREERIYDDYMEAIKRLNVSQEDCRKFSSLFKTNPLFMPVEKLLQQNASMLSGGELQAAAILLLHLSDCPVLLLDEPAKGMDYVYKKHFSAYLKELLSEGKTIIMISHDLEFVSENATHCGVMFDGKIISDGDCHQILKNNRFYTTALFRSLRKDFR